MIGLRLFITRIPISFEVIRSNLIWQYDVTSCAGLPGFTIICRATSHCLRMYERWIIVLIDPLLLEASASVRLQSSGHILGLCGLLDINCHTDLMF